MSTNAFQNTGFTSSYSTGVLFSLKNLPIITLSALYISVAWLVIGFFIVAMSGDLPKSHRKLMSTATKYKMNATMKDINADMVLIYHGLPLYRLLYQRQALPFASLQKSKQRLTALLLFFVLFIFEKCIAL